MEKEDKKNEKWKELDDFVILYFWWVGICISCQGIVWLEYDDRLDGLDLVT